MIDLLRESLKSAQAQVTSLALAGLDTSTAREEVAALEERIVAEENRIFDEATIASDAHLAAIHAEGRRLAREAVARLQARLAAFDLNLKA